MDREIHLDKREIGSEALSSATERRRTYFDLLSFARTSRGSSAYGYKVIFMLDYCILNDSTKTDARIAKVGDLQDKHRISHIFTTNKSRGLAL